MLRKKLLVAFSTLAVLTGLFSMDMKNAENVAAAREGNYVQSDNDGFYQVDGKTYYYLPNGEMATGRQIIDGKAYGFQEDGVMMTGWQTTAGIQRYYDTNGVMMTGLQEIDGKEYYFAQDGSLMKNAFHKINGTMHYLQEDGSVATGRWVRFSDSLYYMDTEGVPVTGRRTIEGNDYIFDTKGIMLKGWQKDDANHTMYLNAEGAMTKKAFETIDGKRYYFDAEGFMVTGKQEIDGKSYYFNDEGILSQDTSIREDGKEYTIDQDGVITDEKEVPAKKYSLGTFLSKGVVYDSGRRYTYYSQSVLPGGGLSIPGRHVNRDGYVADKDGYIVLANSAPKGTVIKTPFGYYGKVYDRGTSGNHFDVYIR